MMNHIKNYEPLVQEIFRLLKLTPQQELELVKPHNKLINSEPVMDVIDFLKKSTKLIVCGDYDCDGICSTTISMLIANKLGIEAGYYIPNRFTEGYGVSQATLEMAYEKGYKDVLIIDNGVKAYEALEYAKKVGLNVAIVDHHLIENKLEVDAFLHPDVLDDYGASMCASGLIYCVAEAMGINDDYMLALAALGTIADVMPLWGKNRDIVRMGIDALVRNNFKHFNGIVKPGKYTSYSAKTLAFKMVPKINSIGRMADKVNVNTAVSFFLSEDPGVISSYIKQVESLNDYRKIKTREYQSLAESYVDDSPFQVISDPSFHEGLVGIVANKIAEMTQKPTVILTEYDDHYKGSARSMTHSLHDIFSNLNPDYFEAMGGHDYAFGMTIKRAAFQDFKRDINQYVASLKENTQKDEVFEIDSSLITAKAMRQLREFEPYGEGFTLPKVALKLPLLYNLVNLKGYGFKFTFNDFALDEAVYFSSSITRVELMNAKYIVGNFDLNSDSKISFNIDSIY